MNAMIQTPVELALQDVAITPDIQGLIDSNVAMLEQRFGRITTCKIIIRGPGNRHQTGGLNHISIRLALPTGRDVNIGRTPKEDPRHADLAFAVNDAFKRARRQLQDHARRMQAQVKTRAEQPVGTVVRIDPAGDFGFLKSSDGSEVYFHRNSVLAGGFAELSVGSRVSYCEEIGEKGLQASTVKPLGKHALRP